MVLWAQRAQWAHVPHGTIWHTVPNEPKLNKFGVIPEYDQDATGGRHIAGVREAPEFLENLRFLETPGPYMVVPSRRT